MYDSIEYKGYRIEFEPDQLAKNPRKEHDSCFGEIEFYGAGCRHLSDLDPSYTELGHGLQYLLGRCDVPVKRLIEFALMLQIDLPILAILDGGDDLVDAIYNMDMEYLSESAFNLLCRMVSDHMPILGLDVWEQSYTIVKETELRHRVDGIYYCELSEAIANWGLGKDSTWDTKIPERDKTLREVTLDLMRLELKAFNQWLEGDVWQYRIYKGDESDCIESCCGLYGYGYAIAEAKACIDNLKKARRIRVRSDSSGGQ